MTKCNERNVSAVILWFLAQYTLGIRDYHPVDSGQKPPRKMTNDTISFHLCKMWPLCNFSFILKKKKKDLYLKSQEKVSRTVGVQKQLYTLLADEMRLPAATLVVSEPSPPPCASVCTSACRDGIHCLLHDLFFLQLTVAWFPLQSKSKLTRAESIFIIMLFSL